MSLPEIDSIWKEHDPRFDRYVQVCGYAGLAGSLPEKMVYIRTVAHDGGALAGSRMTKAKLSAFGSRYRRPEPRSPTP